MKGTLKISSNKGWIIQYKEFFRVVKRQGIPVDTEYIEREIELHPDDLVDINSDTLTYWDGREVEFDIVENPEGSFVVMGGLVAVGDFGGKGPQTYYDKVAKIVQPGELPREMPRVSSSPIRGKVYLEGAKLKVKYKQTVFYASFSEQVEFNLPILNPDGLKEGDTVDFEIITIEEMCNGYKNQPEGVIGFVAASEFVEYAKVITEEPNTQSMSQEEINEMNQEEHENGNGSQMIGGDTLNNKKMDIDIFKIGNIITTNGSNALQVISSNDYQICVKDLLNNDLSVMTKTEHNYKLFNPKQMLKNALNEIIMDAEIGASKADFIRSEMGARIEKFL